MIEPVTLGLIASAIVAGGAQIGGGIMANQQREAAANSANQWGLWMQREQNYEAHMQAYYQRQWQQEMANTAWQRGMMDMRAAGLNPILAYQQGGAASPPAAAAHPGISGPGARPEVENFLGPAAASAISAIRMGQELQNMQAAVDQTRANTNLQTVQAGREAAQTANLQADTIVKGHQAGLVSEQTATERLRQPMVTAQTGAAQAAAGLDAQRTLTEREETVRRGWEGYRSQADANSAWQAYRWNRDWGPSSPVRDAAVSAEQIQQRLDNYLRSNLPGLRY